ncbi:hypothetical protein KR054_011317 [Drosophila jambulina]|nr:hypothetical protein KR054_011317 [Drosophila jambulina]
MDLKVILVVVLATISFICAKDTTYELIFSDEDLFSACPDPAPGTLDVHGFADLSELSTTLGAEGMSISGNLTLLWDIQPQDRVKAGIKLLYFDRGTWTPTFYSVTTNDYCKGFYDPKLPWHMFVYRHVTNLEDVKDKCITPGTKIIFESYLLSASMKMAKLREGFYKVQVTYQAFDQNGTERPTRICWEILGNLQEVSNV